MKPALPFIIIALFFAGAGITQDAAPTDGRAIDWRAAENYARVAEDADPASVLNLIEGEANSAEAPWACASCHGDAGEGAQNIPRLAGMPAGYLVKQLHDYKSGARINDNMQYVVSTLDDAEMAALGAYYAALETGPSSNASLGGDLERGRTLALAGDWSVSVPSCFSCHGALGWGVGETFPAIAGQHPAYTHTQLAAWKAGRRANSPLGLMHSVAASLSEKDMRAVSDYLATLPPPQPRNPAR
ncbi:Cytochrome c553 [Paracoccus solventivorans]|uniref:Cytochrome c553 n=1 Tax=Paracoccus solventivorans TaxID=53463 RepID=A0A1M7K6N9_9RHOB|nr:c-type cytochrome [Paracoccus solventivorans]SHM60969.1 Cytochrome c553 [Paracoccus solventivorans]